MGNSGAFLHVLVNWLFEASVIASIWILAALVCQRLWRNASISCSHQLWRLTVWILFLALLAPLLPRLNLGWFPATSAVDWVNEPTYSTRDFHELGPLYDFRSTSESAGLFSPDFLSSYWLQLLGIGWFLGVVFLVIRFLVDRFYLQQLARHADCLEPANFLEGLEKAKPFAQQFPNVRILRAKNNVTPMSWGLFRPVILLPKMSQSWSEERLELVVLHEFWHVQQRDAPYLLMEKILTSIFWFNPLVWRMARYLAGVRELACDVRVLQTGVKPSVYADHLLEIARSLRGSKRLSRVAVAMAQLAELENRLIAVLDYEPKPGLTLRFSGLKLSLLVMAVLGPLFVFSPWHEKVSAKHLLVRESQNPFGFSEQEWRLLQAEGVDGDFIESLYAFGYRELDFESVMHLRNSGVQARHVASKAALIYETLTLVKDRTTICMRSNEVTTTPNMVLEIDGKLYYALPRCSLLMHRPGFLTAIDPISGKQVDKADAVIGAASNGQVLYFESLDSLNTFNEKQKR